jgi:hypothetical protein
MATTEILTCENCYKAVPTTLIGFVGALPSAAKVCAPCRNQILEQYKSMGKPGQIVILPWPSEAAERFADDC